MIKNYLYLGIVLLVIGVLVLYSVSRYVVTGTPTSVANITVLGGRIGEVPIRINASAISIIFVFASNSTNMYFLNQSAFSGLSGYLNSSPSGSAYGYVKSQNISSADIFLNGTSAVKEDYPILNASTGDYYVYAVIDSTGGSPSSNSVVSASVIYNSYSYSIWRGKSAESLVGLMAIILGIALLIYGAVKKPKSAAVAMQDAGTEKPQVTKRKRG